MKFFNNTIVNFHSVECSQWMEKTLLLFKKHYHLLSLDHVLDYYHSGEKLSHSCHITFDDGDISFYTIVFPLLKKHQIPCSIYVSPEAARKRNNFWFQEIKTYDENLLKEIVKNAKLLTGNIDHTPVLPMLKSLKINDIWSIIDDFRNSFDIASHACLNMNVDQIQEVDRSGLVEIGAHTMSHPILKNETDESSEYEIKQSVRELSDILGRKIRNFAYPNGDPDLDFGEREKRYLKETDVEIAFSTKNDCFVKNDDLYSVPRNAITYGSRIFILVKMLMGKNWTLLKQLNSKNNQEFFRRSITTTYS